MIGYKSKTGVKCLSPEQATGWLLGSRNDIRCALADVQVWLKNDHASAGLLLFARAALGGEMRQWTALEVGLSPAEFGMEPMVLL